MFNLDIQKVIKERVGHEGKLSSSDMNAVYQCVTEALELSEKNHIIFDETAGVVFITHMTTLFGRVMDKDFVDIEESLFDEIDKESIQVASSISKIIESRFHCLPPKSEQLLIASHLAAMKIRMSENNGEVGK